MLPLLLLAVSPGLAEPFALKDGDRVVWIGSAVTEREQRYGFWETALLVRYPDKRITVRNLGWSGDTVNGTARLGFDFNEPKKGFDRLVSLTLELRPTVIFVSYGTNESFAGKAGVPEFKAGLAKLLDALAPSKARMVLFTPRPFEAAQPGLPDPKARNADLALYAEEVRAAAEGRGYFLADLHAIATKHMSKTDNPRFTDNGMHLSEHGYEATVPEFLNALGHGWDGGETAKFEAVRAAVRKKNELFFHRWRPQNETYLFGFRKHEQGKNAKEVAEFDPLVQKAEDELAATLQK